MMLNENKFSISKKEIDYFFAELSKEIKKEFGRKAKIELTVVGGASILMNYDFRMATQDIDAFASNRMSIKDCIHRVGDRLGLPNGWLNEDFLQTSSYTSNLVLYSKPYKTFNQVLSVRTIKDEYLIAMKLKSFRNYKHDLSDIVGILMQSKKDISYLDIDKAVNHLYGGWHNINAEAHQQLKDALQSNYKESLYKSLTNEETKKRKALISTSEVSEHAADSLDDILNSFSQSDKNQKPRQLEDVIKDAVHRTKDYNNQLNSPAKGYSDIER